MQAENALLLATTVCLKECKTELEQLKQVTAEQTPRAEFDANAQVLYLQYPKHAEHAFGSYEIVNFMISKEKISFDGFQLSFLNNELEFVIMRRSAETCSLWIVAKGGDVHLKMEFLSRIDQSFTLEVQSFLYETRYYFLTHNAVFTPMQRDRVIETCCKAWRAFGAAMNQ